MARPTIYGQDMLDKAQDYLDNYEVYGDKVPQVAGLAITIGISRDTVYDWADDEKKAEFSDIVKQVMASQERKLVNGGLDQTFNASMTKLMLCKHGYSEKQEIDVKDTTPPTPDKRKSRISELLDKCKT